MLQALHFATFSGICRGLLGLLTMAVCCRGETPGAGGRGHRHCHGTSPVTERVQRDARSWSGEQLRSGACWRLVAMARWGVGNWELKSTIGQLVRWSMMFLIAFQWGDVRSGWSPNGMKFHPIKPNKIKQAHQLNSGCLQDLDLVRKQKEKLDFEQRPWVSIAVHSIHSLFKVKSSLSASKSQSYIWITLNLSKEIHGNPIVSFFGNDQGRWSCSRGNRAVSYLAAAHPKLQDLTLPLGNVGTRCRFGRLFDWKVTILKMISNFRVKLRAEAISNHSDSFRCFSGIKPMPAFWWDKRFSWNCSPAQAT